MELIFNELSVHGQFPDVSTFKAAVERLMDMRTLLRKLGRDLYCHRNVTNSQVTRDATIPEAIQALDLNSRRALMGLANKAWSFLGRRTGAWRGRLPELHPVRGRNCNGHRRWRGSVLLFSWSRSRTREHDSVVLVLLAGDS